MKTAKPSVMASLAGSSVSSSPFEVQISQAFIALFLGVAAWGLAAAVMPTVFGGYGGAAVAALTGMYFWRVQRAK